MFVIRDIFQLKFGHYKEAKALLDDARISGLVTMGEDIRVLTDFTGPAYRLIMEQSYESLGAFESQLKEEFSKEVWQKWYDDFKQHVESSYREILKVVD